jgi:hypothetical protein
LGDYTCNCHQPAANEILGCVQNACSSSDYQSFIAWAKEICVELGGFATTGGGVSATAAATGGAAVVTVTQAATTPTQGGGMTTSTVIAQQGGFTSPSSTASAASSSSGVNPGIIAGPVVGGVVLLALLGVIFFLWRKKRSHPPPPGPPEAPDYGVSHADLSTSATGSGEAANVDGGMEVGAGVDWHQTAPQKRPEVVQVNQYNDTL